MVVDSLKELLMDISMIYCSKFFYIICNIKSFKALGYSFLVKINMRKNELFVIILFIILFIILLSHLIISEIAWMLFVIY